MSGFAAFVAGVGGAGHLAFQCGELFWCEVWLGVGSSSDAVDAVLVHESLDDLVFVPDIAVVPFLLEVEHGVELYPGGGGSCVVFGESSFEVSCSADIEVAATESYAIDGVIYFLEVRVVWMVSMENAVRQAWFRATNIALLASRHGEGWRDIVRCGCP